MEKMIKKFMQEKTLVLIKPDGVHRAFIGLILQRFEQLGLKIVALKMVIPTQRQLDQHFPRSKDWLIGLGMKTIDTYAEYNIEPKSFIGTDDPEEIGRTVKQWNYEYLSQGPVVALVLQGLHAIKTVRKMVGNTLPYKADPGTIRGDFAINSPVLANFTGTACKNIVHASATPEESEQEINAWFLPEELIDWQRPDEKIMFFPNV